MRLRSGVLSAIGALALTPGVGNAAPEPASESDQFVESIGVNVHNTYGNTPYSQWDTVLDRLRTIGIRHVRDGLALAADDDRYNRNQVARLRRLAEAGARLDLIMGVPGDSQGTVPHLIARAKEIGDVVASLEGPNEFDNSGRADWPQALRAHQRQLAALARADGRLRTLPLLAPSLIGFTSYAKLGNLSDAATLGNLHTYPAGAVPPAAPLRVERAEQRRVSGTDQIWATETGYHNAFNQGGHFGISERAGASYLPRLLLDHARLGIHRSYVYELLDDGRNKQESHFGMLRFDLSMKPAAWALAGLIDRFDDPGPRFVPGALDYTLGAPANMRHLLTQRRDGTFILAVWQDASVWNTATRLDVEAPAVPVVLGFGQGVGRVRAFRPSVGGGVLTDVVAPPELSVPVAGDPVIVEIAPPSALSWPASSSRPTIPRRRKPLIVIGRTGARYRGETASIRVRCRLSASICAGRVGATVRSGDRRAALRGARLLLAGDTTRRITFSVPKRARRIARDQRRPLIDVRARVLGSDATLRRSVRLHKPRRAR